MIFMPLLSTWYYSPAMNSLYSYKHVTLFIHLQIFASITGGALRTDMLCPEQVYTIHMYMYVYTFNVCVHTIYAFTNIHANIKKSKRLTDVKRLSYVIH